MSSISETAQVKPEDCLAGGGRTGALMRQIDWSKTLLGPVSDWPSSLRTAVSICLNSRFPILLWWRQELVMLYNDAYAVILGKKHPRAMGRPGREVWAEIWHVVGPMLEGVLNRGEATWSDDQLLIMDRFGYWEESYFTFSYSPVREDTGAIGGVFCAVTETTTRVLGERRLRTLRELADQSTRSMTVDSACEGAARALAGNPHDVPFALLYLLEKDGRRARLCASAGMEIGTAASPNIIELGGSEPWPASEVTRTNVAVMVTGLEGKFSPEKLPGGAWDAEPAQALVLPLAKSGQQQLAGFIVFGLSPRLKFADEYRDFLDMAAGHVATAVANARAYEEERQRAEALAELDRAKTAFFSNLSHEFRTPLTLMLSPLEDTLRAEVLKPNVREHLELAYRNSLRLLKMVNTMLDFARIEAGRLHASYEPVDLTKFTSEVASVFRSAVERAGMRLVVDCGPLPEPVFVDREMWEKLVLNLLSNAFKFTFDGEIKVSLRSKGDDVELTVSDSGTGIPEDELPHIFERFYRVKTAKGRSFEGSGIGLALVQELAKQHGGSVRAESEVGSGSKFIVTIPMGYRHLPADRIVTEGRSVPMTTAAGYVEEALRWLPNPLEQLEAEELECFGSYEIPKTRSTQARARIVLADDNADMREYVRRLLAAEFEVEAVNDGEAALKAVGRKRPDLVLSDVMMPRLDGFGLLHALRSDEKTATIPVILLSARAGEESRVEGLEEGADDYLIKPFSARELMARIETHLRMSKLRSEAAERARERDERTRLAMEAGGMGTWDVEFKTGKAVWSENFFRLLGYEPNPAGEASFAMWVDRVHPEDKIRVLEAIEHARRNRALYNPEYRILRADNGQTVWLSVAGLFQYDESGEAIRFSGVNFDVTERKLAEDALRKAEKLSAAGRMAATVAHEINNPLASVVNSLYLLGNEKLGPEALHYIQVANSELQRVVRITRQTLSFYRNTDTVMEFDVAEMADEVVRAIRSVNRNRDVQLEYDRRGEYKVRGLPGEIRQLLLNLMTNAVEAGGTLTRVRIESRHRNGRGVRLLIADNGKGIPPENLRKVFEPFFTTKGEKGTGLGLWVTRGIVMKHEGKIRVRSSTREGRSGTVVSVQLPAATPAPVDVSAAMKNKGAA